MITVIVTFCRAMLGNPPVNPYGMDLNDDASDVENYEVFSIFNFILSLLYTNLIVYCKISFRIFTMWKKSTVTRNQEETLLFEKHNPP